jgi:hypothetical protein
MNRDVDTQRSQLTPNPPGVSPSIQISLLSLCYGLSRTNLESLDQIASQICVTFFAYWDSSVNATISSNQLTNPRDIRHEGLELFIERESRIER